MKIEVRRKIATGLVVCIQASVITPRVAETASKAMDAVSGIDAFVGTQADSISSNSNGELKISVSQPGAISCEDPTGGDPTGGDPTGGDPTGGDPTGGDPTGGNPPVPTPLVTDESGGSVAFGVSMTSVPTTPISFRVVSTRPDEAQPFPALLNFWQNACTPQTVTVVGQNDGVVDGDADYEIKFIDDSGQAVESLPGINYDNDQKPEIAVNIVGPPSLMRRETGVYTIRVANMAAGTLSTDAVAEFIAHSLLIESTAGLNITGYACSYLSGEPCNEPTTLEHNLLQIDGLNLAGGETLLISVDVFLADDHVDPAKLTARFIESETGKQTDDTEATTIAIFRSSFE